MLMVIFSKYSDYAFATNQECIRFS